MSKLPAFQFYPADWRKDPGVQALDYHDKGVWFEMLCLMHESDERGKLLLNGQKMPESSLARLLGLDNQILTTTLTTLITYGVVKVEKGTGILYSKRMVSDELLRKIRSEAGKLGGNPLLKQKSTPSSSSSSSLKESTNVDDNVEEPKAVEPQTGLPKDLSSVSEANGHLQGPPPKEKDPRTDHPAIQGVRKAMKKYPDKDLWDRIIKRFGDNPNVELLTECWLEWKECGYNKASTKWLNWYFDGIPVRNGNGRMQQIAPTPNRPTARQMQDAIDLEEQG